MRENRTITKEEIIRQYTNSRIRLTLHGLTREPLKTNITDIHKELKRNNRRLHLHQHQKQKKTHQPPTT